MTFRFSGGNGGGSEIDDVRSGSSPSTRWIASGGVSVAERRIVEDASREDGRERPRRIEADEGRAGSRPARRSTTQVKSGPKRFEAPRRTAGA